MLLPFAARFPSLRTLLVAAVLTTATLPMDAAVTLQPLSFPFARPKDWMRDYTPAQFSQLAATKHPIDPTNFDEPLLAAAVFQETNRQRADLHLPAFLSEEKAGNAALLHARWMAGAHVLSHDEPSSRGTPVTALARLEQQGLRAHVTAENIAFNLLPDIAPGRFFYTRLVNGHPVYSRRPGGPPLRARTYEEFARVIVAQWMHSPGHRAHIVDPRYRFLGVGVALAHQQSHPDTIYAAQEFFTPRDPAPTSLVGRREAALPPSRP